MTETQDRSEPARRPEPRGPLMSPEFWLHHATAPNARGQEVVRRGISIAVDLDREMFGPDGDSLRETLQRIAAKAPAAS